MIRSTKIWYVVIALLMLSNLLSIGYVYRFTEEQVAEQAAEQTALLNEPSFLSYPNLPFKVMDKSYMRGDKVRFIATRHNSHSDMESYIIAREIFNVGTQRGTLLGSTSITIPPGDSDFESNANEIPLKLLCGRYRLQGLAITNGKINTVKQHWYTDEFDVVGC